MAPPCADSLDLMGIWLNQLITLEVLFHWLLIIVDCYNVASFAWTFSLFSTYTTAREYLYIRYLYMYILNIAFTFMVRMSTSLMIDVLNVF